MPRLQDIERFKRDLAALSREEETLARWGEAAEDIPPPSGPAASSDEGAAAALRKPGSLAQRPPQETTLPAAEDASPPDFAALLEGFPVGEEAREQDAAELEALLEPLPEEDADVAAPTEEGAVGGEPAASETADDFSFDLASFAGLEEEPPPEAAESASAEPFVEEAPFVAAPFEEAPFEGALGEEAPSPETAEPLVPDSFALEDFSFEAESASEVGTALPEGDAGEDFSIPEMPSAEVPSADALADEGGGLAGLGEMPSFGEAPGAGAADAFESFSFEEPGGSGAGVEPAQAVDTDLDEEIAALGEAAPAPDTFALDQEWGGGFGSFDIGTPAPRQAAPRLARPEAGGREEKARPVSLNESQVDRLQDALLSYPLNLRVAIEEAIVEEKGNLAQRSKLVWAMAEGRDIDEVALLAGRLQKRRIEIPKGYEKKTGAAIEAEKGTFRYAFVHTLLPALKAGLVALVALGLLGYLGWRFVYTPLAADALYRSGYRRIAEDRFPEADQTFTKATAIHEFVAWYYRYAEAYAAKRQYLRAERKYEELLAAHPREKAGVLAWARLERDQMKYRTATEVLRKYILERDDYFNKDALLLLGDVYLEWAGEDPAKYEEARRAFAGLIQKYGAEDLYMERMLLYSVRTGNDKEVKSLKTRLMSARKMPLAAATLAELAGYLLDRGEIEEVLKLLSLAVAKDRRIPDSHYELARYYARSGPRDEERKALDNAILYFEALPAMTGKRTGMYIDSLLWRGKFRLEGKEWIGAEADFASAATAYEKALELKRLAPGPRFAEAYAGLAEVAYRQRNDLDSALRLLERAAANGFDTADARYKRGVILYAKGDPASALEQFYWAGRKGTESPYLLHALGAAFYARKDYSAAEGYFRAAAEFMRKEYETIDTPRPGTIASEAEVVELFMKAENNLGAALVQVAGRVGDARVRDRAALAFAEASRLFETLRRTGAAPEPSQEPDLGTLNMNAMIQPRSAPVIYAALARDMSYPRLVE